MMKLIAGAMNQKPTTRAAIATYPRRNEAAFFLLSIQPKCAARAPSIAPCGSPMKTTAPSAIRFRVSMPARASTRSHDITFRGRLRMNFEAPRMNGNFGIAMITFILSPQFAFPLMNEMNSSPVSLSAMRANRIGPWFGQCLRTVRSTPSIQTSTAL